MSAEATGSKSLLPVTIWHISFPSEAHQELRKVLLHTHTKKIKIKEPLFVLAYLLKKVYLIKSLPWKPLYPMSLLLSNTF